MRFVPVPGTSILMCTTETTIAQWKASGMGYQAPKFAQGSDHPALNVSWNDATAWCQWLGRREGRKYRLPSEKEWSAAVGPSPYPWGTQWPPPDYCGNYMGQEMKSSGEAVAFFKSLTFKEGDLGVIAGFRDRHVFTAPVGSYAANRLGIHDLGGNVSEWCEDWYDSSRKYRVLRGGSWDGYDREYLASSHRQSSTPDWRGYAYGFRCVVGR